MASKIARFRSFPLPALWDRELSNADFDVLVAKCFFHNDEGSDYWEKAATPPMLAKYTARSERRIRERLPHLAELGYLSFERHGPRIVDIRWGDREDVQNSVRRIDTFVRLPLLVLEDTSLQPHERRAYLVIVDYSFRHGSPFYLSSGGLGRILGHSGHQTAAKTLKCLRERNLVAHLPQRDGDSVSRMFLTSMEVAYPDVEHDEPKPHTKPLSTKNLLDQFEESYHQTLGSGSAEGWTTSGALNRAGLGEHIKRWIKQDGTKPEVVAAMIEIFFKSHSRFIRSGREEVWKQFINSKALLERFARNRVSAHAPDDLGWDDPWDDGDDDDDMGWGESQRITNLDYERKKEDRKPRATPRKVTRKQQQAQAEHHAN